MTILEQLATTTHPTWVQMIDQCRKQAACGSVSGAATSVRMTMQWGRTGGSHYKDGQFFKK